jgi:uncharacterized protein
MKRYIIYIIIAGLALTLIFLIYPRNSRPNLVNDYRDSINQRRQDKENYMRNDPDSPFRTRGAHFDSLRYFHIDPDFKITAGLKLFPLQEKIRLPMNDGTVEYFIKYASVDFSINGQPQQLILYKSVSDTPSNIFFLPFFDETSSIDTYGGGRFLDPEYNEGTEITLDFNLAYNPYCAYVDGYVCPLPPPENKISVAVTAGEKNYKVH